MHRLGSGACVVGQRVWEHDGVRLGMRQVEAAAQCVTEFVVQAHRDLAKDGAAEPGTVERVATCRDVAGSVSNRGQSGCDGANAFFGQQCHDGIAVVGVQRLGRVSDAVDAADDRHADRQRQGQARVIDDCLRQHLQIASGLLDAGLRDSVDGGHFASRIRGRHRNHRQSRFERDGFSQADGRTAAGGDHTVRSQASCFVDCFANDLHRHVHARPVEDSHTAFAESGFERKCQRGLLRGRQHEGAGSADPLNLGAESRQRTGTEDHALRETGEGECLHRWSSGVEGERRGALAARSPDTLKWRATYAMSRMVNSASSR